MLNKLKYLLSRNRKEYMFKDVNDINMKQLRKKVSKGAILLDVRSPQEFNEGHLSQAILIPEYELLLRLNDLSIDKSQPIVVCCSSGIRSKRTQQELNGLGYKNVYNLYKGLEFYD